ncbi:MAG: Ku protein [Terriglobia bacterium]
MRALWTGSLGFGLVNIPIKIFPAVSEKAVRFNYLHGECEAPVNYQRTCSQCGKLVPWDEIIRGYQHEKGHYVTVTDEDVAGLPEKITKTVRILDFVDLAEIDPIYFRKPYFLVPEQSGVRAYILLRDAMTEMKKVAVAKVVIKGREYLGAVRVKDSSLLLETMYFGDEIRDDREFTELEQEVEPHSKELKMARTLIENLATNFDPDRYKDEYREALLSIVHAKVDGTTSGQAEETAQAEVIDLMEALRESVDKARKKKAG